AEDARRDADLADVVEERAELELLHPLRCELHLAGHAHRQLLDLARVRGRVAVVRLGRVRERLDVENIVRRSRAKFVAFASASFAWCESPARSRSFCGEKPSSPSGAFTTRQPLRSSSRNGANANEALVKLAGAPSAESSSAETTRSSPLPRSFS